MIYIPTLKNRQCELNAAKKLSFCFGKKIIPLFEIVKEDYLPRYEKDPVSGEFIRELKPGNIIKTKRKIPSLEEDIKTLKDINNRIAGKEAFIDFLRFNLSNNGQSGKKIKLEDVQLSWANSNNIELYKSNLRKILEFSNFIPVISIKESFEFNDINLRDLCNILRSNNNPIALRITDSLYDKYTPIISSILNEKDYLLYDIGEQSANSKIVDFEEIAESGYLFKFVVLNSPRKRSINNCNYPHKLPTTFIDTSAKTICTSNNFYGFGDYCGLKDILPQNINTMGKGTALALIYNFSDNLYYTFLNPNTALSFKGFKTLVPDILSLKNVFSPNDDCPILNEIETMESTNYGNYSTWIKITISRTIYQMYKYLEVN